VSLDRQLATRGEALAVELARERARELLEVHRRGGLGERVEQHPLLHRRQG
jgi:hypothetical protein